MSEDPDRVQSCYLAIREVLLREWDPIGCEQIPVPEDEYDSYIGEVYQILFKQKPFQVLVDYLWWAETQNMGLSGNRRHTERVAKILFRLLEKGDRI